MPAKGKRQREPSAPDIQELTALHRSRLVDWLPVPVVALAPTHDGEALAVGCENGRVELWDTEHDSCLVVGAPAPFPRAGTWPHPARRAVRPMPRADRSRRAPGA